MLPPRAVIFDMDGVIVDSEPLHERAFRDVFAELGFADTHGIDFPAYYGRSDLNLWRDFIARHQPPHPLEELLARKERRFEELLCAGDPIFPGLPELLAHTAARCAVGLASGSRHATINSVLSLRDLRRHFRAVVSSDDVPRGKPAPDVFLRAAELLGVEPVHCVVIEDSEAGVAGARAASMTVIAITNSLPAHRLSQAHHIVGTCAEIQPLLFPEAG